MNKTGKTSFLLNFIGQNSHRADILDSVEKQKRKKEELYFIGYMGYIRWDAVTVCNTI